jgi:DNA-binding FadR family transcriptional regulator
VAERVHEALAELMPMVVAHAVSPAELMSARLVLEPALIDMAIGNATPADFARMDECNHRAEMATTLDEFEHWDAALHEAIAEAAHNGFISGIFKLMSEVRSNNEWGALKRRSATPERRLEYQQEHRALVAALKARDAERARALCLAHLVHVRTSMLGY